MGLFGLFKKKEETSVTLPQTDTERWIVGTYAMWSEYAEGDWHYFAGSVSKNRQEGASMRLMLRRDWEVNNRDTLLEMVRWLTASYDGESACTEDVLAAGAWNLCRACQILGMGFVSDYISREEMIAKSVQVGKQMQRLYHSWAELYASYLKGYKEWKMEQGGDWPKEVSEREILCDQLRMDAQGPCSVPWDLELG